MSAKRKPYPFRILSHIARLPDYVSIHRSLLDLHSQEIDSAQTLIDNLEKENAKLTEDFENIKKALHHFQNIDDKVTDLQYRLTQLSKKKTLPQKDDTNDSLKTINNTVADDHSFDLFYKKFEDRFRGSEELIQARVAEHLPLFTSLSFALKKKPVVDIGCGRGEFLAVLDKAKFKAIGVDMNEDMVKRANDIGLVAIQDDALSYLSKQKTSSLAAVSGFHIVEHIPFESLMEIFAECYRVVAHGGFALFETPNPRSLNVGANTFYTDPSHIKPIPPSLLAFMLEYVGFEPEIIELHRTEPELHSDIPGLKLVHDSVFGYADYAVIARRASLS